MITVGLSKIQASDYSFEAGDKGMTFGASIVNSVHIKTIAPEGMTARLFGHRLHVGCMIISIQGRQITGETNALAIAQAHALRGCILTISVPPEDNITWMTDNIEGTRPSVDSTRKTTDAVCELDALRHASDILIQPETTDECQQNDASLTSSLRSSDRKLTKAERHRKYGHIGHMDNCVISENAKDHAHTSTFTSLDELTAPVVLTGDFVRTTTNFVMQSHLPETSDCSVQETKAIASSFSTVITMSDNLDISDTSTIHSNAQSEAVTAALGNGLSDKDGLQMG
jgi:hypothetical protein